MAIIAFPDSNPAHTPRHKNMLSMGDDEWASLQHTLQGLNACNAVMFESDMWFIHLANASVLFKSPHSPHWLYKPEPISRRIYTISDPSSNQHLNGLFAQHTQPHNKIVNRHC